MKLKFTLIGLLVCSMAFSQQIATPESQISTAPSWVDLMQDPNANFYDVQKAFNAYWQGRTIQKGKGYKQFRRWEALMAPRVYPSGDLKLPSQNYENFLQWKKDHPMADKSANGNWTSLGPVGLPSGGGAGRLNFIRIDPNNSSIFYVGAPDGGLWKSTNSGTTFTTNTDNLPVIGCSDIAIDPTNSNTMYLATGDGDGNDSYSVGVLKSTDGGATWNTTGLNWTTNQARLISRLLINPSNPSIIIAATNIGIYRTTDAGVTWTQERAGSYKDAEFKPGDPNTVYAAGTSFVKSTDGGNNWSVISAGLPTSGIQRIAIAVTAANPAYVYLLYGNNTDYGLLGIYRSTDSGTNFTRRDDGSKNLMGYEANGSDAGGQVWYDLAIAASPNNAEELVVGGVNVWRSTNGGSSWSCISQWIGNGAPYIHADQHDLIYAGSTIYAGNDGGIFRTTNSGSSWSDLSSSLVIAQQYRISQSANLTTLVVSGHQDNGSNIKSSGTWTNVFGGDGMDCLVDRTNNNVIYVAYQYGAHQRSTDGGFSFTDISASLPAGSWVSPIHQDPTTANTIYVGGRNEFYKSTDRGNNWTMLGTPPGTAEIVEFAIAPSNNQIIYALQTDKVSKSTNGGTSFSSVSTGLPVGTLSPTYVAVSATDPNTAWVTFSGYSSTSKVYVTTNGGTSWTNISTGLPNVPVNVVAADPAGAAGAIYIGTDVGVYYRDNATASWVLFSTGLPVVSVRDLEIHSTGVIRAGTFGRGLWESDLYNNVASPPVADFSGTPTTVNQGSSVTFTNLSTNSPSSNAWTFAGGTPASSSLTNPIITYNTPGTYDVSLTATNAAGSNSKTKTAYITVLAVAPPVTNFTASQTNVCPGQSITFTSTGTGSPSSYSWSFPGGTPATSNSANPTIVYNVAGTYDVTLTTTNAGGSDPEVKTGYITVGSGNGLPLPFSEGFTGASFPPSASWSTINAGGSINWVRSPTVGNTPTTGNSMFFDNYSGDDRGFNDEVRLPGINLTGVANPVLTFDVAYAPYSAVNFDGLEILISVDCGLTFTSIYSKSGTTLATAAASTSIFTPTSGDWRNDQINLSAYSSAPNAIIAFRNLAGYGNVLYVDNISINGSVVPPTAAFTSNATSICAGSSVTYTSTSTGNPTGYSWSFPGGSPATSNAVNPTVTYSTAGTYDVSLTVSNGGGSDIQTSAAYVTVKSNPPTPSISASGATTFCSGSSVTLTSSSASNNLWSNGATSNSITVSNSGTFAVTVTVNGCSAVSTPVTVTSNSNPIISKGTVTAPTGCTTSNGSVQITGSGTGNLNWTGTATGNLNNVTLPATVSGLAAGTYSITFTNANGCASNVVSATLTGPTPPSPPTISADGPLTFCTGDQVTLTSSSATNNVWSNGSTSSSIVVTSSGTYTLILQNGDCQSTPVTETVTVLVIPFISVNSTSNPTSCGTSTGSISINGGGTGSLSWTGTTSSGSINVTLPATISNLPAGSYSISLFTACSSNTVNATLADPGAPPVPVITPSGNVDLCDGDSVVLTSSASNNTWSTGESGNSIVVKASGDYSVITELNGCFSGSDVVRVNLIPPPVVTLAAFADVCHTAGTFALNGGNPFGGSYSGPGVSGGAFNPATAGIGIHTITYTYTAANGCTGFADTTLEVINCAGINELANHGIKVYPNPADESVMIEQQNGVVWKNLVLVNMIGQQVYASPCYESTQSIRVKNLAAGIYQLILENDQESIRTSIYITH